LRRKEVIEANFKLDVMNWDPGPTILDDKIRVKLKINNIIKSKLTNGKKVFAYVRNMN
jgi:hypothetical protein